MEHNDKLVIEGLAGRRELAGRIPVKGAKNAALKALAAGLLFRDSVHLTKVPEIDDVSRMVELLEDLGVGVERDGDVYQLQTDKIKHSSICPKISAHLRASVVLAGPLLARTGRVTFPHPGGCVIGKRPIDFFLENFAKMGATVKNGDAAYELIAGGGKLKGADLFFRLASVTGTETFMMAGVLAEGETIIRNAAMEPEIVSLGEFLNQCGAQIAGLGTPTITIQGGELLTGAGQTYETIADRIEAGSFIILGALAGRDLTVTDFDPSLLESLLHSLRLAGVQMEVGVDSVRIVGAQPALTALEIKTHEYPGFPTDLQAPMAVFLTQTVGQSYIFETIFEGRLNYLETLERMGAKARIIDVHRAFIDGPTPLAGKEVESPDLRAGLAYVLAGIIASGRTVVHNIHYIDRGYESIDQRLAKVGVNIKRINR